MEFNEIITKEREILRNTTWYPILRGFIEGKEFEKPFADACTVFNDGNHFYPTLSSVFKAFTLCDYNNLKMVLFNAKYDDDIIYTNGLALGYVEDYYKDVEKRYLLEEGRSGLRRPLNDFKVSKMEKYARQGVLCINDLLIYTGNINHDKKTWMPFFDYLFDMISDKDIVRIGVGDNIKYKMDATFQRVARVGDIKFVNTINSLLEQKNLAPMDWL